MATGRLVRDLQAKPDIGLHKELLERASSGFYNDTSDLDAPEGAGPFPLMKLREALLEAGYSDLAQAVVDGRYDEGEASDSDDELETHCEVSGCTEFAGDGIHEKQGPSPRRWLCTPHWLQYLKEGEFWVETGGAGATGAA